MRADAREQDRRNSYTYNRKKVKRSRRLSGKRRYSSRKVSQGKDVVLPWRSLPETQWHEQRNKSLWGHQNLYITACTPESLRCLLSKLHCCQVFCICHFCVWTFTEVLPVRDDSSPNTGSGQEVCGHRLQGVTVFTVHRWWLNHSACVRYVSS